MTIKKVLVTRNECREIGLKVSNTQFQRWEEKGLLTAHKPGQFRSARVYYRVEEVYALLGLRTPPDR